jgi:hypothetical protein
MHYEFLILVNVNLRQQAGKTSLYSETEIIVKLYPHNILRIIAKVM